jgi:hypothetical protein
MQCRQLSDHSSPSRRGTPSEVMRHLFVATSLAALLSPSSSCEEKACRASSSRSRLRHSQTAHPFSFASNPNRQARAQSAKVRHLLHLHVGHPFWSSWKPWGQSSWHSKKRHSAESPKPEERNHCKWNRVLTLGKSELSQEEI